jgi:phosphonate transport system substrate-binding protein
MQVVGAVSFVVMSMMFVACGSPVRSDAPQPEPPTDPDGAPIYVAMSAAFVSDAGVEVYEEITTYLEQRTGRDFEFVTGLAYETIDAMVAEGVVGVAFVCGYPYVLGRDRPDPIYELIAAPVMADPRYRGAPIYFSDLIVRADSKFESIEDLRGARYAYNEETSNSGYNMPRAYMIEHGLNVARGYFGEVVRSGSHEESIRMVAEGEADASFVDSLVLDYDRARGEPHARAVRVIESMGPAAVPPAVASTRLPAAIREEVRDALVGMAEDERGRQILEKARLARFVAVDDHHYDDIRAWHAAAVAAGYQTLR